MVLISGSSGFIGQQLINVLLGSEGLSVREKNWFDKLIVGSVLINLVGKAHDHKGTATEQDYYYVNLELTKQIFNEFVRSEAKMMIHVSSLAALEEFESDKYLEEDGICSPESWYGKSKRAAEEWLLGQVLPSDKKLIIIRPPMVHGPGDKGNLGLLYRLVSRGLPYPLSSFNNKRSFISIDNFCYFIKQIIENQDKLISGIYHIADDEALSTKEIVSVIQSVTGKNSLNISFPKSFIKVLAKLGDTIPIILNTKRLKKMTSNLLVSNKKIKSSLGIDRLPLTAKEGLEKTILSFKNEN